VVAADDVAALAVALRQLGGAVAAWLPPQYEASALIEGGKVLSTPVEQLSVLREKMNEPTYYASQTLVLCGLDKRKNPGEELSKALKPTIAKQSTFLAITFKAKTTAQATACLEAVLKDVQRHQSKLSQPQLDAAQLNLQKEKALLKEAEDFVAQFSDKDTLFKFGDAKFSSTTLLLATLQSKQSQVLELRNSISKTQLELTAPQTQVAEFAIPIYAPDEKVEPKTPLLLALGLLLGGFLGLIWLIGRKAYQRLLLQLAVTTASKP
jgi:LPS O-antigen subunit length determinant protein (WzzB/FepE family)